MRTECNCDSYRLELTKLRLEIERIKVERDLYGNQIEALIHAKNRAENHITLIKNETMKILGTFT